MPRKKPDVTPFYPEDKDRIDGVNARTPYFSTYYCNVIWAVKDNPATQRMVKCQGCDIIIPRNVPRVWLEAAFRHSAGHWCMSCARDKMAENEREFLSHINEVQKYIGAIRQLIVTADKTTQDQRYIDALAMGKMISVIKGKEKRFNRY